MSHLATITNYFGNELINLNARKQSYDLLRTFVDANHDWKGSTAPDSVALVFSLSKVLSQLSNQEFAFLLCHTGFIPEDFEPDSSEETIYTKMVEALVGEWAKRIGFNETTLPKQKSSKEDVTVQDKSYLIVCDAKSFRLGRSQKAPNVKDALKEGDIPKWLKCHNDKSHTKLGGLVTFPSQHDWSGGSDFYLYLTRKDLPIVCLFYEHMAFAILTGIDKSNIISLYESYKNIFPHQLTKSDGNRAKYWSAVESHIFSGKLDEWKEFQSAAQCVIGEKIHHTIKSVETHLKKIRESILQEIPEDATITQLREMLVEARAEHESFVIAKQLINISNFRDHSDKYIED